MGQLEAGAHQPGQIGVHFHRGQQQLFGVGVGVVVVEAALRLLDVVDAAPHGSFPQGQVVDVLDAVKGHGVKQHQTLQLVLVFLLLGGVIEQVGHQSHTGPQHGHKPHQNQDRDQQAQRQGFIADFQYTTGQRRVQNPAHGFFVKTPLRGYSQSFHTSGW